jgi:hypothetical protein
MTILSITNNMTAIIDLGATPLSGDTPTKFTTKDFSKRELQFCRDTLLEWGLELVVEHDQRICIRPTTNYLHH